MAITSQGGIEYNRLYIEHKGRDLKDDQTIRHHHIKDGIIMTQKATIPKQHSLLTQIVFNTGLAIKLDINGIEIIKSAQLSDKIALQLTEEEKNGKKIILLWKTKIVKKSNP
ncbi:MAG: hypothetical protein EZS28_004999 [Streblomastix strix]|uniref:Uncharacterized protein n=1 Tax=Streblomastix strix TaxID=222440 RepID=A0A5J4WX93_9EUKA|nr:MAG: hypothetical protein EZS28_004999 [Streblomastix strix]